MVERLQAYESSLSLVQQDIFEKKLTCRLRYTHEPKGIHTAREAEAALVICQTCKTICGQSFCSSVQGKERWGVSLSGVRQTCHTVNGGKIKPILRDSQGGNDIIPEMKMDENVNPLMATLKELKFVSSTGKEKGKDV